VRPCLFKSIKPWYEPVLRSTLHYDDAVLVQEVCAGDDAAAERLFVDVCGQVIECLSKRFDYEDLLVDLYIHLSADNWRRLRTWRGESSIQAWITQVALRLCYQHVTRNSRETPVGGLEDIFRGDRGKRKDEVLKRIEIKEKL